MRRKGCRECEGCLWHRRSECLDRAPYRRTMFSILLFTHARESARVRFAAIALLTHECDERTPVKKPDPPYPCRFNLPALTKTREIVSTIAGEFCRLIRRK